MEITQEQYNSVINGLRVQLELQRAFTREITAQRDNTIKERDELCEEMYQVGRLAVTPPSQGDRVKADPLDRMSVMMVKGALRMNHAMWKLLTKAQQEKVRKLAEKA